MKIKLDENLPQRLIAALTDLGHDVDTAVHEGLTGRDDGAGDLNGRSRWKRDRSESTSSQPR